MATSVSIFLNFAVLNFAAVEMMPSDSDDSGLSVCVIAQELYLVRH
jgi:hypothetical protein